MKKIYFKKGRRGKDCGVICNYVINYVDFWLKTLSRAMKRYEFKMKLLILL